MTNQWKFRLKLSSKIDTSFGRYKRHSVDPQTQLLDL
jgi:hypothetical protein